MAGMNIYQVVTDRIIEQLEKGTIPWHKPWFSINGGTYNGVTGHPYSLMNSLLLPKSGEWASYNQWLRVGGQVRHGEKSSMVVFWKWQNEVETDEDGDILERPDLIPRRPILKYYHVFHVSQVDGVVPMVPDVIANNQVNPIGNAEKLLQNYLGREQIGFDSEYSDKACYVPATDTIHMPKMNQFHNSEEYYSTAFHEAIHSTGYEKRMNRKGLKDVRFGSDTYSKEELIAELGAVSILHGLGIETESSFQNSAAYISGWLDVLKRDKRCIMSAAGQAEKAARYILGEMQLHDNALTESEDRAESFPEVLGDPVPIQT